MPYICMPRNKLCCIEHIVKQLQFIRNIAVCVFALNSIWIRVWYCALPCLISKSTTVDGIWAIFQIPLNERAASRLRWITQLIWHLFFMHESTICLKHSQFISFAVFCHALASYICIRLCDACILFICMQFSIVSQIGSFSGELNAWPNIKQLMSCFAFFIDSRSHARTHTHLNPIIPTPNSSYINSHWFSERFN